MSASSRRDSPLTRIRNQLGLRPDGLANCRVRVPSIHRSTARSRSVSWRWVGLVTGRKFDLHIASILLSLRHPFAPNDHVSIGGEDGHVVRLTSRATILLTVAGNHLRIPNANVLKATILNYSRNAKRRFDFEIGVGTEEDIPRALSLGTEALKSVAAVLEEPRVLSIAESLGESTVQPRFHGWIDQTHHDILKVKSAGIVSVKSTLDAAGIEMPEPIYRVQTVPMAKRPTEPERASTRRPRVDVSAERQLGHQIELERGAADEDLLNEDSPLE